jgi:RHS repeat-associated protein
MIERATEGEEHRPGGAPVAPRRPSAGRSSTCLAYARARLHSKTRVWGSRDPKAPSKRRMRQRNRPFSCGFASEDIKASNNFHRWYRREDGRYLSPDPIGLAGGEPGYSAYVNLNPLGRADPLGLSIMNHGSPYQLDGGGGPGEHIYVVKSVGQIDLRTLGGHQMSNQEPREREGSHGSATTVDNPSTCQEYIISHYPQDCLDYCRTNRPQTMFYVEDPVSWGGIYCPGGEFVQCYCQWRDGSTPSSTAPTDTPGRPTARER